MKDHQPGRAIGIDFGGTFVKMALVDSTGVIHARQRVSTAEAAGQEAWLAAVAKGAAKLQEETGCPMEEIRGIGIGVPGFVDFERGYVYDLPNVPGWKDVHLAQILQKHFGVRAIVDNDVNAMALGEFNYGAGRDYDQAVFVTLGTGVGGGIVIGGKVFRGAYSMAGEIGHVSIDKEGIRSAQGRGGVEQYVGNRAIVERALREIRKGRKSSIADLAGQRLEDVTPKHIADAAAAGDELGIEVFDFVADCLATAFASVTYLIQPEVFIVGGGVAQSGKVLFDPLKRHLKERLSPVFAERIDVLRAKLGNDAGVIGSASLVWSG